MWANAAAEAHVFIQTDAEISDSLLLFNVYSLLMFNPANNHSTEFYFNNYLGQPAFKVVTISFHKKCVKDVKEQCDGTFCVVV